MNVNEGNWSYMGQALLNWNMVPYIDTINNKTPGIYYTHLLGNYLYGTNYLVPRFLGIISILIFGMTCQNIFKRILNENFKFVPFILLIFSAGWDVFDAPFFGTTEVFMALFSTIAYYILISKDHSLKNLFLIGALFGLAYNFKQIALVTFLGTFIVLIFEKRRFLKIIFVILGFIITNFFFFLPLYYLGVGLKEYLEGTIFILQESGYPLSFWRIPKFFNLFFETKIVIFYPILLFGFFQSLESIKNFKISRKQIILALWAILAFLGVNASGDYYNHHLIQLLPPLSILTSISLYQLTKNTSHLKMLLIITLLLFYPFNHFFNNLSIILGRAKSNKNVDLQQSFLFNVSGCSTGKKIGNWLKNRTSTDDHLYFIGYGDLNQALAYSQRRSASPHFNAAMFVNTKSEKHKVHADLRKNKPTYIGVKSHLYGNNFLSNYIDKNYKKVKQFDNNFILKRFANNTSTYPPPQSPNPPDTSLLNLFPPNHRIGIQLHSEQPK